MCEQELSETAKTILAGRIYPAIQACVGNRYKIVISIFAFYSFMMTSTMESIKGNFEEIKLYGSVLFTLLTFLNFYNYVQNSGEQFKLEKPNTKDSLYRFLKRNDVELIFLVILMILVWGSFALIRDC
jgi:uncharacterized membrane protein